MFILYANKNQLVVRQKELVTSGSVNVYTARFGFSPDWNEMAKTIVFRTDTKTVNVLLGENNECVIPWEVLEHFGVHVFVGVYGTQNGEIVLPTIWADLGVILEGAGTGADSQPPTPGIYEQILDIARAAADIAQSVRDDADAGKFQGEKGNVYFASFAVEPETGLLKMYTPTEYEGPSFCLNNEYLEVSING